MTKRESIGLMLSNKKRRKYEDKRSKETGIYINNELVDTTGQWVINGIINYIIRVIIVYFGTVGSIECYMSSFNIEYSRSLVWLFLAVAVMTMVLMQYSMVTRLLGYIAGGYGVWWVYLNLQDVIKSGILAMANQTYEVIRLKYMFPTVDGFDIGMINELYAINVLILIGGLMLALIMSDIIVRYMNIMLVLIEILFAAGFGMFFGAMPSYSAILMVIICILMMTMLKFNYKYKIIRGKNKCNTVIYKSSYYYSQGMDGTVAIQMIVIIFLSVSVILGLAENIYPKVNFDSNVVNSRIKEDVDVMVKDIMILAFSEYKNYDITANITHGQLSNYGNIELDMETDIKVKMAPYTQDRMYLRSFVSSKYEKNAWLEAEEDYYRPSDAINMTSKALEEGNASKAKMQIENVDIDMKYKLIPYYAKINEDEFISVGNDMVEKSIPRGNSYAVEYYPYTNEDIKVEESEYREYVYQNYLEVPEENRELISNLCQERGFTNQDGELAEQLREFFQNEYKYTLNSGLVPWKTDFINYFLFQNKKGVCVHFASSAAMIYRTLGIPARYVEGYAVDYANLMMGEADENENPAEWIEGIQPLAPVMTAEISDSSAHAWIEVYRDGFGWEVVDVTPIDYGEIEESTKTGMRAGLSKLMEGLTDKDEKYLDLSINWSILIKYLIRLMVLCICGIALWIISKIIIRIFSFHFGSPEKNAINRYNYMIKVLRYIKLIDMAERGYKEQCKEISSVLDLSEDTVNRLAELIEKMLFSSHSLKQDEYKFIFDTLSLGLKNSYKKAGLYKRFIILIKI